MSIRKIYIKANAEMKPCEKLKSNLSITDYGIIEFKEDINGKTSIKGSLKNMPPGFHGIHIHEKGEVNEIVGCETFGSHYNPYNKTHGARTKKDGYGNEIINHERHLGDLGNINVNSDGTCEFYFLDDLIKLSGDHSVIGRSILIHAEKDDLGQSGDIESKKTGHSGHRLFYGIIHKSSELR